MFLGRARKQAFRDRAGLTMGGREPIVAVRRARPADAADMARLFHETVHRVNARDYADRQLQAWSPNVLPAGDWRARQRGLHVWVASQNETLLGFAELDPGGHIDCFFVSHRHQRMGVGERLMSVLLGSARRLGLDRVEADVSVTAEPFFRGQGFISFGEKTASRRGVSFRQFHMYRVLGPPG